MKKILLSTLLLSFLHQSIYAQFIETKITKTSHRSSVPDWIKQGNIYEVNIRQYTPEGTLKAFAKHLDRLQMMGVQTLWFMPINPISKKDRKGSLGSYYAVSDYTAFNPEFGTREEFRTLVQAAHSKGMKVIIDWVPNHSGADNRWLTEHLDFYVKDSAGNAAIPADWSDVRQLNYQNQELHDSMIAAMKYWVSYADIDGFRCDVAWMVPGDFWSRCIRELKSMKDLFMLAEGDKSYLVESGFDAVYPWGMFHMMEKIAHGERPAFAVDSIVHAIDSAYPPHIIQMYFTSNHDENSWNKADYETFAGDKHGPFMVLTQTMVHGVPLIYSGQEEPVLRAIKFFDKDTMTFDRLLRATNYRKLLELRKRNTAMTYNASFRKVTVGNAQSVYAYLRQQGDDRVLVILNLSPKKQKIKISDNTLYGTATEIFNEKETEISGRSMKLPAWGYLVFEY